MRSIGRIGWVEKERPVCGPLDAIVRPLAVAPCTSDVHTCWEGAIGERTDMILGHEACGEVVEVGALVKDFKPGDHVLIPAITPDWSSTETQSGYPMHSGGMLSDMVPTGLHGVELAQVTFGDDVLVVGIGPVGLMAVAGANLHGAAHIIAVGSRPVCQEAARSYGATDLVNYRDGAIENQVMSLTDGRGVDKVVIAGGDNDTFASAVKSVRPGGIIGNVNYLGDGEYVRIPRVEWGVGMGHITITGGLMPGGRLRMEKLARLVSLGKLNVSRLITHRFQGFEHVEEALWLMKDKPADLIKPVVVL